MLRLVFASIAVFLSQPACAQNESPSAPTQESLELVTAGKVDLVEGDVRFVDAHQLVRRPSQGDPIYEGESIVTGADGEVHLAMEDGGYIGVRSNTRMRIVNYKAEGGDDDRSVISLLEGSFRSVTGWIARLKKNNYTIQTPTVTIGVRGTDHEPMVIPEGSTVGEPGTYERVNIGTTEIHSPQGVVSVNANQAGFVPRRGDVRPRLLARIPVFYRPARNERRFEGLHDRIHRQLEEHRQLRVRQVEEHRQLRQRRGDVRGPAAPRQDLRRQEFQHREQERRQQTSRLQKERETSRREFSRKQRERVQPTVAPRSQPGARKAEHSQAHPQTHPQARRQRKE